MELDVLETLQDLNYPIEKEDLEKATSEGPLSVEYTKCVEWLTSELKFLYNLDEHVSSIKSQDDVVSFLMETTSFLKELGCEYKSLTEGDIQERLKSRDDRLKLLDYLTSELLGARIYSYKNSTNGLKLVINESPVAASIKKMLIALKVPRPPDDITPDMLFKKIQSQVDELRTKCISDPLFTGQLNEKQWKAVEQLKQDLHDDYTIRRQMMLKRLDVTIQSFQWSERMKGREDEIAKLYCEKRKSMSTSPKVKLSDLISARHHLAILEKTSNSNVRKNTKSRINSVIIGTVPDRGGRPADQQPPPPEMPSWAPRSQGPPPGGRGGGGRGGGNDRGGRVQGGWNDNQGGRGRGNHRENDDRYSGHRGGRVQGGWNNDSHQGGRDQGNHRDYDRDDGHRGGGYRGRGRGRGARH